MLASQKMVLFLATDGLALNKAQSVTYTCANTKREIRNIQGDNILCKILTFF